MASTAQVPWTTLYGLLHAMETLNVLGERIETRVEALETRMGAVEARVEQLEDAFEVDASVAVGDAFGGERLAVLTRRVATLEGGGGGKSEGKGKGKGKGNDDGEGTGRSRPY